MLLMLHLLHDAIFPLILVVVEGIVVLNRPVVTCISEVDHGLVVNMMLVLGLSYGCNVSERKY